MNKKIYFSSVAAAVLLSACSSDELVPQQKEEVTDVFANRPKIEVAFGMDTPMTRMFGVGNEVKFSTEDQLGAVLVDKGETTSANWFDLMTENTHIGNNRFEYKTDLGKFVTDGTMCVGAWLFYAPYNSANTTGRGSIKYNLPVVQKYAPDFSEIAKNDFKFSPIVNLDGQEDGYFDKFTIRTISAFTYAGFKLKFDQAVKVQKLVLKPAANANGTSGTPSYDPFATQYELNMGNASATPVTSGLSAAVADLNNYPTIYMTQDERIAQQTKALMAKSPYIKATAKVSGATEQLIALDCLNSGLEASNEFEAYMLIPSDEYTCIRLYAYTDKGIYVYNINDECEAAPETSRPTSLPTATPGSITLKREYVWMHNIDNVTSNADYDAIADKCITMTTTVPNTSLSQPTETDGTVVISQEDLVAVINGIKNGGNMVVRLLGTDVKITEEVAKAIREKDRAKGDIQVIFNDVVEIEGSAEGYVLSDVTFNGGAKLTTGTVNMGSDIDIPTGQMLTVKSGATLNANTVASSGTPWYYKYDSIENYGTLNAKVTGLEIGTVKNYGTLTVEKNATINTLINSAAVTVNEGATLTTAFTNNSITGTCITNNGTIMVTNPSSNSATIINNSLINVTASSIFTNNGTINNNADAKIISGQKGLDGAIINNVGTIDNDGLLYCYNNNSGASGQNIINNTGTINANAASTTYITTNSFQDETSGTRATGMKMGVIKLASRNEDVSVTETKQKGYIVWETSEPVIRHLDGDKYNKVILKAAATVSDSNVRYIETNANELTINTSKVQELVFSPAGATTILKTITATVGYLEIANGKMVKLPTNNNIEIKEVNNGTSKTTAEIKNGGTLLVGGDLYSTIDSCPTEGTFAAGDGGVTAFHWGHTRP